MRNFPSINLTDKPFLNQNAEKLLHKALLEILVCICFIPFINIQNEVKLQRKESWQILK